MMFDKLFELLAGWVELFRFWTIVQPYEGGVVTRLGKFRKVLEPGFYWVMPLGFDRVITEYVVPRTHSISSMSVTTSDGKQVAVSPVITYKVHSIQKAVLEVEHVETAVRDSCVGTIGHVLCQSSWADIVEGEGVLDKLTEACRKKGFRWGIEIMSVQLAGVALVRNIRFK